MSGPDRAAGDRMAKAREIALHPGAVERTGADDWVVTSQTGAGRYRVWFVGDLPRCSCPDYAHRLTDKIPAPCKHILAVVDTRLKESDQSIAAPDRPPRRQYPQHPSYTRGQTEELRLVETLLRELVNEVPDFPRTPGLPGPAPAHLSDELYCAILKVYSGLSGRRAVGVFRNVADKGLLDRAPSFMVASNLLVRPEATSILYRLLALSALPLAGLEGDGVVAPDSTGIQTTSFGAWREQKHRERREKKWLKVHAIVGTRTHVIIRAFVGDADSGDAPQFGPLLRGVIDGGFAPGAVVADRGYLSKANYSLATDLGLEAFIPFKSNSLGHNRGSPRSWRRAYHLFQANREEFDRRYHVRSNVESVFSALKRKFGENIRSRAPVAQINEVLCKLIAYNLTVVVHEMFESGIAPTFNRRG